MAVAEEEAVEETEVVAEATEREVEDEVVGDAEEVVVEVEADAGSWCIGDKRKKKREKETEREIALRGVV